MKPIIHSSVTKKLNDQRLPEVRNSNPWWPFFRAIADNGEILVTAERGARGTTIGRSDSSRASNNIESLPGYPVRHAIFSNKNKL